MRSNPFIENDSSEQTGSSLFVYKCSIDMIFLRNNLIF